MTDPHINASVTERDGEIWREDAVELFLDTLHDGGTEMRADDFQFIVSAINTQADSTNDKEWNAVWQSQVVRDGTVGANDDFDRGYVVEIAVPWQTLGWAPAAGDVAGMGFAMDDLDPGGTTYAMHGGITQGFRNPSLWDAAIFSEETVAASSGDAGADATEDGSTLDGAGGAAGGPGTGGAGGTGGTPTGGAGALDDLPYRGRFLGCPIYITTQANTRVGELAAYRFRAEKTGNVVAMRTWLKTNKQTSYEKSDPADETQGYSTSYGGTVRFELRADDGTTKHLPSSTVLGETHDVVDERLAEQTDFARRFALLTFKQPVHLEADEVYHLVHHQVNPSRGTISINDALMHGFDPDMLGGPYWKNDLATFRFTSSGWQQRAGYVGLWELHYSDGAIKGQAFAGGRYELGAHEYRVDGAKRARMKIVIPSRGAAGGAWIATEIWVFAARVVTQTTKPLTVTLVAGNSPIESVDVPASAFTYSATGFRNTTGLASDTFDVRWASVALSQPRELVVGQTYFVELSAAAGAGYTLGVVQDFSVSWPFDESKSIGNKHAENMVGQVSTDGGQTWTYVDGGYGPQRNYMIPIMIRMQVP